MEPVLILGGSSDIGLAIARRFARAGHPIHLAARNPDALETDRSDIHVRFDVDVTLHRFDVLETDRIAAFFEAFPEIPGILVCTVGLLGDNDLAARDPRHAEFIANTNFLGPALAVQTAAALMAKRSDRSLIIGIGSVAGDRGRAKNYWYGAGKAGFAAVLSGLRQTYARTSVDIVTIKPGFVDTRMIADLKTPALLTASAEDVADRAYGCLKSGNGVIYVGRIWRLVMAVVKFLPERIFVRLQF